MFYRSGNHRICAALIGVCVLTLSTFVLVGCTPTKQPTSTDIVTVTDSAGREVKVPQPVERIVSLAPANTETLFALGLGDKVVGVTTYDDYPAETESIEKVGDFVSPNLEKIAALDPDLVFATGGIQAETIAALEQAGALVVVIDPTTVDEIMDSFMTIGLCTGVPRQARELVEGLTDEIETIKAEVQRTIGEGMTASTFVEIGNDPLFTVGKGTLLDEMLAIAGGSNIVTEEGYVPYSAEQVVKASPYVYLATSGSGVTVDEIKARKGYAGITAVKKGNVIILDENLVSRPGPRFVEGIREIYEGIFQAMSR